MRLSGVSVTTGRVLEVGLFSLRTYLYGGGHESMNEVIGKYHFQLEEWLRQLLLTVRMYLCGGGHESLNKDIGSISYTWKSD